jgi:hypothetical protein
MMCRSRIKRRRIATDVCSSIIRGTSADESQNLNVRSGDLPEAAPEHSLLLSEAGG